MSWNCSTYQQRAKPVRKYRQLCTETTGASSQPTAALTTRPSSSPSRNFANSKPVLSFKQYGNLFYVFRPVRLSNASLSTDSTRHRWWHSVADERPPNCQSHRARAVTLKKPRQYRQGAFCFYYRRAYSNLSTFIVYPISSPTSVMVPYAVTGWSFFKFST